MAIEQVIAPTTGAVTEEWDSSVARRHGNDNFVVSGSLIAGGDAQAVAVEIHVGDGTWHAFAVADTAVTLDDAQPHATLPAGPRYRFVKGVTAGACGVYVQY